MLFGFDRDMRAVGLRDEKRGQRHTANCRTVSRSSGVPLESTRLFGVNAISDGRFRLRPRSSTYITSGGNGSNSVQRTGSNSAQVGTKEVGMRYE